MTYNLVSHHRKKNWELLQSGLFLDLCETAPFNYPAVQFYKFLYNKIKLFTFPIKAAHCCKTMQFYLYLMTDSDRLFKKKFVNKCIQRIRCQRSTPFQAMSIYIITIRFYAGSSRLKKISSGRLHKSSPQAASGKINCCLCSCFPLGSGASSSPPRLDILKHREGGRQPDRSC